MRFGGPHQISYFFASELAQSLPKPLAQCLPKSLAQCLPKSLAQSSLIKPNPKTHSHSTFPSLSHQPPSSLSSPPRLLSPHLPVFSLLTSLPHHLSSPFQRHTPHTTITTNQPPRPNTNILSSSPPSFKIRLRVCLNSRPKLLAYCRQNSRPSSNSLRFRRKSMQMRISIGPKPLNS